MKTDELNPSHGDPMNPDGGKRGLGKYAFIGRPTICDEEGYPYSDGRPLGESTRQINSIIGIWEAARELLEPRFHEVSMHCNMFWYWEEGNRTASRDADLMVIFGVPFDHNRLSYKSWKHGGIVPGIIIETVSHRTRRAVLGKYREIYERTGVREYFVFDGPGLYMDKPLHGFYLEEGRYQQIRPDEDGFLISRQLGVKLRPEGNQLRLADAQTGQPILTPLEKVAKAKVETAALTARLIAAKDESIATINEVIAAKNQEIQRMRELLKQAGITPPETP
ncbi:Uma2 family endonuclease [Zavarzinella formosa]|uniref:Uma2 family endonuclease n=1 Tax=Zavarzinella formosa TaxID=360055 RepID=UPI0002D5B942|nr:Uma2 family endonuclease [Zavarzinella formosa]